MKKGFALLAVVFVIVFFAVVGLVIVSMLSSESILAQKQLNSTQAFFVAAAGLNFYLTTSLEGDSDWRDNVGVAKNFGKGYFVVSFTADNRNRGTLEVTGYVNNVSRKISGSYSRTSSGGGGLPGAFSYSMYSGNAGGYDLVIENSVTITGDFYYYGDVTMQNSASLTDGTMYSLDLDLQGSSSVAADDLAESPDVPELDTSSYDAYFSELSHAASSALSIKKSQTYNLSGSTHYFTSVSISGNATLVGPGTIVVKTGDFSLSGNGNIGDDVVIIAANNVNLSSNGSVGDNLKVYAQDDITLESSLVVPADALFYSQNGDISTGNSSLFTGVILAPNGEVTLSNSSNGINGLIYCDSLVMENSVVFNGSIVT
ncbi:MAG: polymer-forming cytoskeletal protein, partial [Candidatus Margulisbacteria bacterium]|nr:polymer-forming cytoskeletal protein [Candidatus Margulisiibacteriota bacterium]